MEFLTNYWFLIVIAVAAIITGTVYVMKFVQQPGNKQLEKVKEWLLYAVTAAEQELGSGTGKIKLRYVYDMFIMRFPWLARTMTFEAFSLLVDEVLNKFNGILSNNDKLLDYVNGEKTSTTVK